MPFTVFILPYSSILAAKPQSYPCPWSFLFIQPTVKLAPPTDGLSVPLRLGVSLPIAFAPDTSVTRIEDTKDKIHDNTRNSMTPKTLQLLFPCVT